MIEGPHVKEWRRKQEAEHAEDWRQLLRQTWGRRLLLNLIESTRYCGAFRSMFIDERGQPNDPATQTYLSGRRDVGLVLFGAAQDTDIELFARMLGESTSSRRMYLNAVRADEDAAKEQK
jgi:hypothetical protein